MASFFARHGAGEILARYSFIEPMLQGRRVLELGAAEATEGAGALLLAERGAAAVVSLAGTGALEAVRAAGHHPFVRFDDVPVESLPEGAFDLILLADGAPLADDPARLTLLRRLLADKGHLVTAIPAAGGRSLAELAGDATPVHTPVYETFITALTEHFPWVEVATQSASVGYVIAVPPPEGEEPEVSIDGSQAGDAEAAAYLAICGEGPSGLSGITMVALPSRRLLDDAAASGAAAVAGAERAGGVVAGLEARVAALGEVADDAAAELFGLRQEQAALTAERDALLAGRKRAAEEREGLLQDRETAMAAEAEARAALERQAATGRDLEQAVEREAAARREQEQALERLRSVQALCDAEREAGAAARSDAERLGSLLGLRDRELGDLRGQLEGQRQRLAEAELEAARVGEERTRAVTELAERSSQAVEIEAGLRAARAEAQAARAVLEGALARADSAEARVQELEDGIDARIAEFSTLRAELETLRAQAGGSAELEATLRARAEAAEAAVLVAHGNQDQLREEAVTSRGEAEAALREIDEARGEASRATAVLAELRVELRATGEALDEARAQLEAARSAPAPAGPSPELEERLAGLVAEVARLTGEASHLSGERDGLAAQLDEAHGQADREREQLVAQLDEARSIIQGAADRLRELEAEQAAADGAAGELEAARAEAVQAGAALAEARQVAEAAEGQAAGIGAELQAVRWEKEEIEQKLAAVQQRELERAAERGGAATRLRSELEALRAEAEPLSAELARLRGAQEVRDLELEGLRTELGRVQGELAERATSPALDIPADTLSRMVAEKAELAAAVADRDQRIARLQREVTDKTERLGRLASEVGELKAKGIGKIFR